jgi:hypothetical protein
VNEKVLENGSPAVGMRGRLLALGLWSASFVQRLSRFAFVIGAVSISVFILLLVSTTQLETCAEAEWNAGETGTFLAGAG